jgi:hypothetical protein
MRCRQGVVRAILCCCRDVGSLGVRLDSRQPVFRWCTCLSSHNHGAVAAVGVGARPAVAIGVAVAVAFAAAAGIVKEPVELGLAMRSDLRSTHLSRRWGGIGALVHDLVDCSVRRAGEMLTSPHGGSRAGKLRAWQTASGCCMAGVDFHIKTAFRHDARFTTAMQCSAISAAIALCRLYGACLPLCSTHLPKSSQTNKPRQDFCQSRPLPSHLNNRPPHGSINYPRHGATSYDVPLTPHVNC